MYYDIESVLPEYLVSEKPELVAFIKAYYDWLEQDGNPGSVINKLSMYRDMDRVAVEFLEYLQREIAISIPANIRADKRKLYKNAVDIYLSRGSEPSYKALFNLVFNDEIELFFPRVDILKPSDGKWDAANQRWLNDDGKLSVKKFIQDSRFYQSFSYVIKTGQTIDFWRDSVKTLLHPAGFAFFGQVSILSDATKKMPKVQPGEDEVTDQGVPIILPVVQVPVRVAGFLDIKFTIFSQSDIKLGPTWMHIDRYKFINDEPISRYGIYSVGDAIEHAKTNISIQSDISTTTV